MKKSQAGRAESIQPKARTTSMAGVGRSIYPTPCKQLRYIGRVEEIALIAELAVNLDCAMMLNH
jgi:hypothetical protein